MRGLLNLGSLLLVFLAFPAAVGFLLRFTGKRGRPRVLAVLSLLFLPALAITGSIGPAFRLADAKRYLLASAPVIGLYVLLIAFGWVVLRAAIPRGGNWPWAAILYPIAILVVFKYTPREWFYFYKTVPMAALFIGLSYIAFRMSHLALEVKTGVAGMPTLSEYVGFAFYPPTLAVGPISRYSLFIASLRAPGALWEFRWQAAARVLVGLTKYLFCANLLNQLTYAGLLGDGNPHGRFDILTAIAAFYLYLYANFSGYCDMAIGVSGLLGIHIEENFDSPLKARNLQEFWKRWHITLGSFVRDLLFSPLSKALVTRFGVARANHAIAAALAAIFLVIGVWHGAGWNFVVYGALHAAGVITVHYYTNFLKKKLGRAGYQKYEKNGWIEAAGIAVTQVYVALTLLCFVYPLPEAARLVRQLF